MKKLPLFAVLAVMIMSFYGCPVGLDYPLGNPGKEKIDKNLIGTWTNDAEDPEVRKLTISKNDDYSYKILVIEKGSMYSLETDNLMGWITDVDGKKFFYAKPDNEEKYYHYMIQFTDKKEMTSCDVSLLDGGVDSVTSTDALRKQVAVSLGRTEFCDEKIVWKKE